MSEESAQQFANLVLKKGTKISKSDKDLMNQFVRGLSNECRSQTIALGPNSLGAKTFGLDDSTGVLQKQEINPPNQDTRTLKQVNSKLKCAYCTREEHHSKDHSKENTTDNQITSGQ